MTNYTLHFGDKSDYHSLYLPFFVFFLFLFYFNFFFPIAKGKIFFLLNEICHQLTDFATYTHPFLKPFLAFPFKSKMKAKGPPNPP